MPVALTDEEYRRFREWVAEEYGLDFGPEKRDILRARLEPRRAELGLESFERLLFQLKFHPEREAERRRLAPHLTNNESYFFRERRQLEVLHDLLPTLRDRLAESGRRELRLLSAGCGLGQEPYTLAIVVRESGLFGPPRRVRITGVDVDDRALEYARAACYREHAFRGVESEVRERYFRLEGDEWRLVPQIREAVAFQHGNLVDPCWRDSVPPQDVIFCRNVLIYFDDDAVTRAVEGLYHALVPGGYLFLGHAETLSRIPSPLRPERRPGAVFYRRMEE